MPIRNIRRQATAPGLASGAVAPVYIDSDDNRLKLIPAGTGTTEQQIAGQDAVVNLVPTTVTLTSAQSGLVSIQTLASGTQTYTLPAATSKAQFTFVCGHADSEILVNPAGTDVISLKATEDAGAHIIIAGGTGIKNTAATNVLNDHITLASDGVSKWYMIGQSGIWASQ